MKSKIYFSFIASVLIFYFTAVTNQHAYSQTPTNTKMKILIHVTIGPENPTKAALAFLVARTAIEEGHTVTMFLAGDAVQLIRDNVLDNLAGLGTGKLRDHFDAIVKVAANSICQVIPARLAV